MKPHNRVQEIASSPRSLITARYLTVFLLLTWMTFNASAQTVTWEESFTAGQIPSEAQCQNWTTFLNNLGSASFQSVTLTSTATTEKMTISDATVATKLAQLLNSKKTGSVVWEGNTWTVSTRCGGGTGSCVPVGLALTINGEGGYYCDCDDKISIRPQSGTVSWGGFNTETCDPAKMVSQTMKLEFQSQVDITISGPTTFCEGGSVRLTANTNICSGSYDYVWSNGATGQSIEVKESGNYYVVVTSTDGCVGTSVSTAVTVNPLPTITVDEKKIYCEEEGAVELTANGNSSGTSTLPVLTKFCLFDAPGATSGCIFTKDLCNDGYEVVNATQTSKSISTGVIRSPSTLKFLLYFSASSGHTTFSFKVNGVEVDVYKETLAPGICRNFPEGRYPIEVEIAKSAFSKYWNEKSPNILSVDVTATELFLGGITAEVVSDGEFYRWFPVAGLSDPLIKNPKASPQQRTPYEVTYTLANGCSVTAKVEVDVTCELDNAPIAACQPFTVEAVENCKGVATAKDFDNGSASKVEGELEFSVFPEGPYPFGKTNVTLTVFDKKSLQRSTCDTWIMVTDTKGPVIAELADLLLDNDAGKCSATKVLPLPEIVKENCEVATIVHDKTDQFAEGETLVTWTVTDVHGNVSQATQKVIVTNADPVIKSVTASQEIVSVGTPVSLSVSYNDNNVTSATIDWDDHSGLETSINPGAEFNVSHTYDGAGLYSITVTLTDACGRTADYVYDYIVVYDRNGGFVTGGGWFNSPAGAHVTDPGASGKATFSFNPKYKKKGSTPEGNADFEFKAGKLKFKSQGYKWLVVEDARATFAASGRVGGTSGYQILISVVDERSSDAGGDDDDSDDDDDNDNDNDNDNEDGDDDGHQKRSPKKSRKYDQIRVKISDASGTVVYDTQLGLADDAVANTKLGGGSIQIHHGKPQKSNDSFENLLADNLMEASTSVYPNPFTESIRLKFFSPFNEHVNIQLLDITGRVVYDQTHPFNEEGSYSIKLSDSEKGKGIYILKIKQGKKVELLKLVRE